MIDYQRDLQNALGHTRKILAQTAEELKQVDERHRESCTGTVRPCLAAAPTRTSPLTHPRPQREHIAR